MKVNWTELGSECRLTTPNRGQIVLAQNGIPMALQKRHVKRYSQLKLPGGEISYPTHSTVAAVKTTLAKDIEDGVISLGKLVVPHSLTMFD